MDFFSDINYLAVVVSAIVYYMIGFIWFTLLYGKLWAKENGVAMDPTTKPRVSALVGQFISTLLYTLGIAVILGLYGAAGPKAGITVSAVVTLLFVIPINSGNLLFTGRKKLFLLDVCERAIGSLVIGIILGVWN